MKGNRVKSLEQSSNPLESDDVQVQGNTVSECGTGIAVETWGWLESSGSYNKIVKNNIIDCAYGISIAAYDLGGYSSMDARAFNNKVTNNTLSDNANS